jgi:hypothetical protein
LARGYDFQSINHCPSEFISGKGTKQEAMTQQIKATKMMVSVFEISRRKNFFIINVLKFMVKIVSE